MSNENENLGYWALGFMWGNGTVDNNGFVIKNINYNLLKRLKNSASTSNDIIKVGDTWRLYLPPSNKYVRWILNHGYEKKLGNAGRSIPTFSNKEDEAEFLRGFFSTHCSFVQVPAKRTMVRSLYFCSQKKILERLNTHLHENIGTSLRKLRKHACDDNTYILQYAAVKEILSVIDYLQLPIEKNIKYVEKPQRKCADPECGKMFVPKRNDQKFCSVRCRNRYNVKVFYDRKKETKTSSKKIDRLE